LKTAVSASVSHILETLSSPRINRKELGKINGPITEVAEAEKTTWRSPRFLRLQLMIREGDPSSNAMTDRLITQGSTAKHTSSESAPIAARDGGPLQQSRRQL